MANLVKRPTKPELRCKKHPKHRQSPGVCSVCLREKLSQLSSCSTSSSSSRSTVFAATSGSSCSSSSAASSYYSSSCSSVSSSSSPVHFTTTSNHHRKGKNSLSLFLFGGKNKNNVLTKSRSMAFVPRNIDDKKVGFFSKLLLIRPRTNNKKIEDGNLLHSRSIREIRVAAT
ncbi:hypothetical protein Ddye_006340 [Dipteronia dyeriana]|uniref:Uncharacterized protein n=1 Tax=Dipteronia dyeriana TaxID=168575 RepID=A0AAD9XIF0_9ROSI|nr:hypothetical protein Ddye_006340 [Dipteronia dyeriana]